MGYWWLGFGVEQNLFSGSPSPLKNSTIISENVNPADDLGIFAQNTDFPLHANRTESELGEAGEDKTFIFISS